MKYKPQVVGYDSLKPINIDGSPIVPLPLESGQVRHIEIKDPNSNGDISFYSIGYRYKGGREDDPTNWSYAGANYFDGAKSQIQHVGKKKAKKILRGMSTDFDDMLRTYLKLLK